MSKIKRKINLSNLFYNNKFVIIFSIVMSFIIWIVVSSSSYQEYKKVVSDIPVTIPLSDAAKEDGLRVFNGGDITAEVTVSGNRVSIGMISKDNIQIIARQASSVITSPGNYFLELTANKKGTLTDYDFASPVSPNFITVSVDRVREATFKIENEVKYNSDPAYFAASTAFSETSVTISGPESKVMTIAKVVAKDDIKDVLKSTVNKTVPLTLYDSYGGEISKDQLTMSVTEVNAVIPILYRKSVNVTPDFVNPPDGLDTGTEFAKVEPGTIEIAGPEDTVKNLSEVKLSSLDFSEIGVNDSKFELPLNLPNGCRDMGSNQKFVLTLNMDKMRSKEITVSKTSFINIPEGKNPKTYNNNLTVNIVGPSARLSSITSEDVVAEVDLKDNQDYMGYKELPVKIKIKSGSGCWAYGKYTANVSIE